MWYSCCVLFFRYTPSVWCIEMELSESHVMLPHTDCVPDMMMTIMTYWCQWLRKRCDVCSLRGSGSARNGSVVLCLDSEICDHDLWSGPTRGLSYVLTVTDILELVCQWCCETKRTCNTSTRLLTQKSVCSRTNVRDVEEFCLHKRENRFSPSPVPCGTECVKCVLLCLCLWCMVF